MKIAVIQTGGKQYVVSEGTTLKIEKLKDGLTEGDSVTFDQVLMTDDGAAAQVGKPATGGTVEGTVTKVGRHDTIRVVRYKAKSRYHKANGHRQPFTEVKIGKL